MFVLPNMKRRVDELEHKIQDGEGRTALDLLTYVHANSGHAWQGRVKELAADEARKEAADVRRMVVALASALGYEWVPDGKTEAKWKRKPGPWDIDWDALPKVKIDVKPSCPKCDERAVADTIAALGATIGGRRKGGRAKKVGRK